MAEMEKKFGVYICTGCSIGEAVDVEKLVSEAAGNSRTPAELIKTHPVLCSPGGLKIIRDDLKGGTNTVVIAACSGRVKYEEFDFPGTITERANIRELVAWSQPHGEEDTLALAVDYVTMAVVKARKDEMPEPRIEEDLSKTILVVGGGITGLSAALDASGAGYDVVLVEKEAALGGHAAKLLKQVPLAYPYDRLEEPAVFEKIKHVVADDRIKVYTSTTIEKTVGQPGLLDVTLRTNGSSETLRAGAIVLAVGYKPYDATKLTHLGYGKPDVVTSAEFEEIAKKGKILRPSDGREAKRVAFIQCAGSRDPEHLPYCSSFCCAASLRQARYVREMNPEEGVALIFYRDIRTPGQTELFYKKMQDDPGVMLTQADVTGVGGGAPGAGDGALFVEAENTLLGEKIRVQADLVVLATGIVPATAESQAYLDGLTNAGAEGDEAKQKYVSETTKPEFILNLDYHQGPELPSLENANGFADSNFICFQYETRRTGIYAAGCVRQPMSMAEAVDDAAGAAMKAVQCVEQVAQGMAVHPRAWDITYPDAFLQRCTACKRCTEECPFGAIEEDEKGIPDFKINRCRRCGTCMGSCPERIVSFKDFHVDMVGAMLKSIEVPDEGLRILCLACENDAYPALDAAGFKGNRLHPAVRFIPVRCLGATNLVWVADAFSRGIDGILLLGCKFGEDYQCHFVKGSELAEYRFGKVQETLDRLQLEAERCQLQQVAISDYDRIPELLENFVGKIEEIGPNPFKGF